MVENLKCSCGEEKDYYEPMCDKCKEVYDELLKRDKDFTEESLQILQQLAESIDNQMMLKDLYELS